MNRQIELKRGELIENRTSELLVYPQCQAHSYMYLIHFIFINKCHYQG